MSVTEFFDFFTVSAEYVYYVFFTNNFKKDLKKCFKRNLDLSHLAEVIKKLAKGEVLPPKYKVHQLEGYTRKSGIVMECHIQPDWLLIWVHNDSQLSLTLTDTGTHSDLF
ncbi:MAG: type II toxin-antitoxin system YafQ family toxin [Dysgonamonadaceae bacterium]|nr:type II toxin-antitoxin system YafQ family toxin [Dysgonamonadaceae bacterium]